MILFLQTIYIKKEKTPQNLNKFDSCYSRTFKVKIQAGENTKIFADN